MRGFWAALAALAGGALSPAHAAAPTDARIREILQERIAAHRGVGLIVGMVDEKGRRVIAAGTRDLEGGGAIDGDTLFEIGSVTKVFTAALLAEMAARGEVSLDDPVAKLLPRTLKLPRAMGGDITLLQLATHSAGLPRIPENLRPGDPENPYADYTVEQLYAALAVLPDTRALPPPGERYSNLGAGLLGHALALKAGKDFESLMRERILAPLGMTRTVIALSETDRRRLASPHYATLARGTPWDLPTLAGAGALRSSMNDLLAFAEANLGLRATPLQAVLAATHRVVRREAGQALGWVVRGDVAWHNGATGGSVSHLALDLKQRRAVVVLANSQHAVADIAEHLIDPSERLQPVDARAAPPKEARLADPQSFDEFVGTYRMTPSFAIGISREGERYYLQATNQPRIEMFPAGGERFFLRVVEAAITFGRDRAGKVTHLLLDQNGRVQRAERAAP